MNSDCHAAMDASSIGELVRRLPLAAAIAVQDAHDRGAKITADRFRVFVEIRCMDRRLARRMSHAGFTRGTSVFKTGMDPVVEYYLWYIWSKL